MHALHIIITVFQKGIYPCTHCSVMQPIDGQRNATHCDSDLKAHLVALERASRTQGSCSAVSAIKTRLHMACTKATKVKRAQ